MRRLRHLASIVLASLTATAAIWSGGASAAPSDSTAIQARSVAVSNCPNIDTEWYGAGTVPAGYYKDAATGSCLDKNSCNSGFNEAAQRCNLPCETATRASGACSYSIGALNHGRSGVFPNRTTNYSGTIQASCSDGSLSYTNVTCAPATPNVTLQVNDAMTGGTYQANNDLKFTWSATNAPTSATVSCGALGAWAVSPPPGGSVSVAMPESKASVGSAQNCIVTATNASGSGQSNIVPVTISCGPGKQFNSSTNSCNFADPRAACQANPGAVYHGNVRWGSGGVMVFRWTNCSTLTGSISLQQVFADGSTSSWMYKFCSSVAYKQSGFATCYTAGNIGSMASVGSQLSSGLYQDQGVGVKGYYGDVTFRRTGMCSAVGTIDSNSGTIDICTPR